MLKHDERKDEVDASAGRGENNGVLRVNEVHVVRQASLGARLLQHPVRYIHTDDRVEARGESTTETSKATAEVERACLTERTCPVPFTGIEHGIDFRDAG